MILLGDAIHARRGRAARTLNAVAAWRECHPQTEMLLVRGNHDRASGDPPRDLRIRSVEPPFLETPFAFQHYPGPAPGAYALAGHMHPAIRLTGRGKQKATLVCFWFTPEFGLLPAFGALTGAALIDRGPRDRVYAIAGEDVIGV